MSKNNFINLLQFISCSVLLASFFLEFFFNVEVCHLCIIQRALWVFLIFITIFLKNKGIILLIILTAILVSGYHIFLQYNIIENTPFCKINFSITNSLPISCSTRNFEILNLPIPVYNFIINILLFVFIVKKMSNTNKEIKDDEFSQEKNF